MSRRRPSNITITTFVINIIIPAVQAFLPSPSYHGTIISPIILHAMSDPTVLPHHLFFQWFQGDFDNLKQVSLLCPAIIPIIHSMACKTCATPIGPQWGSGLLMYEFGGSGRVGGETNAIDGVMITTLPPPPIPYILITMRRRGKCGFS